jgi:SPP1 family predicted phage head-tail adaptor
VYTPNDSGGGSIVYSDVATVGCRIGELTSLETQRAGANAVQTDVAITVAFGTDIRATDRVVTGGKTYEVTGFVIRTEAIVGRFYGRESL